MLLLRRAGWIVFFVVLAGCAVVWRLTQNAASTAGFLATTATHATVPVSERPLAIADAMAGFADTPAETDLANQAQAVARKLLNEAIRQEMAGAAPGGATASGPLAARLQVNQAAVARDTAALTALQARARHATAADKATIEAQLQLRQAQLQLDQARLADAEEDYSRAAPLHAGDSPTQVVASEQAAETAAANSAHKWRAQWQQQAGARNPASANGLAALTGVWRQLAAKHKALVWAQTQAAQAAAAAQSDHNQLHAQLAQAEAQNGRDVSGALGQLHTGKVDTAATAREQAVVHAAEQLAAGQRRLIGLDHAAQFQGQLTDLYQRWVAIATAQEELALHDALGLLLAMLAGLAVLLACDWLATRALARSRAERRRLHTMRRLLRFIFTALGVIWVLLMLVGGPERWLTFLGLAGAGLTVALQDTILSFFGWFVLMGRRGLAPGDWVEINHISGEVVEITLLQTVLREAGNWTEPGHPTGRRVLFPNSFVFTGPYLKFTSHGQWLWDEVRLPLPEAAAAPDLVELARWVEEETRADADAAARDWDGRGARDAASPALTPSVQIKPGQQDESTDLCIRYITTAAGRAARRERLYHRLYETQAAAGR